MRKADVTRARPSDKYQETRVEDQVDHLLQKLQPTQVADQRRSAVFDHVREVVKGQLPGCEVYSVGSFPLKTYLPCADVDMVMFVPRKLGKLDTGDASSTSEKEQGAEPDGTCRRNGPETGSDASSTPALVAVNQALCMVAAKRLGKRGVDASNQFMAASEQKAKLEIRNVSFVNARTPMVTMLVGNVVVDLTENQAGSVAASVLLEEADRVIQRDHLFKRSLLLLKAWALCETPRLVGQRVLGAREGGLTSYGLAVMVLHIFGVAQWADSLSHPLDVFIRFFEVFAKFDWSRFYLTLDGPVPFEGARDHHHGDYDPAKSPTSRLWPLVDRVLEHLSPCAEKTERARVRRPSRLGRRSEGQEGVSRPLPTGAAGDASAAHFPVRYCNIQDPLNALNNLGHSVSRRHLKSLECALQRGRQLLEESGLLPRGNDVRECIPGLEQATVRAAPEGNLAPNGHAPGRQQQGIPPEPDHGDPRLRLDSGHQSVSLGAAPPMSVSPVLPRQVITSVPVLQLPTVHHAQVGILLGPAPATQVPPAHPLVANAAAHQLRLAQSPPLVHLHPTLYHSVYQPYVVPEPRVAVAPVTLVAAASPPGGQVSPLMPTPSSHGNLTGKIGQPDFRQSSPYMVDQRNKVAADDRFRELGPRPLLDASEDNQSTPGRAPMLQPNTSQPGAVNGHSCNVGEHGGHAAEEWDRNGSDNSIPKSEPNPSFEDDRSRCETVKPVMLPWNLPSFSASPTSSTASMSESAEGSKDDPDRHSLCDNSIDDEIPHPTDKSLKSRRPWPPRGDPASSYTCRKLNATPGRRHQDQDQHQHQDRSGAYGRCGKRSRKSLDARNGGNGVGSSENLSSHWFLRFLFPQCCQLYGSGDGFREDLLDHPCQHWSNLQQPAGGTARAGSHDLLAGPYSDMWKALEDVGRVVRSVPQAIVSEKGNFPGIGGTCGETEELEMHLDEPGSDEEQGCDAVGSRGEQRIARSVEATGGVRGEDRRGDTCTVEGFSRPSGDSNATGGRERRLLTVEGPTVQISPDDESGSTTSEEQGDKRDTCGESSDGNKDVTPIGSPALVSTSMSYSCSTDDDASAPTVALGTKSCSVIASTPRKHDWLARSSAVDVGVQCSPRRSVSVSCGTQWSGWTPSVTSTSVQCTLGGLESKTVSRGTQCLTSVVEKTCAGVQCSLTASNPATADSILGSDHHAETYEERPLGGTDIPASASQPPEGNQIKGNQGHAASASASVRAGAAASACAPTGDTCVVLAAPRQGSLDDVVPTVLSGGSSLSIPAADVHAERVLVGRPFTNSKKHKKRKNKTIAPCAPASPVMEPECATALDDPDVKQRTKGPSLRFRARVAGRGFRGWAGFKVLFPGCGTSQKRRKGVLILSGTLSLFVLVGVLWLGVTSRGTSEAKVGYEKMKSNEHMKQRRHQPPLWVMVGGSLTLGDAMGGRADDVDGFQWLKDGEVLPGRTSSFLSIAAATLEDEGTYTCLSARATGPARHTPLWEEATVRVSELPSVESQLQTQRLARGEMLAIVATASGVPQPQYQWRRDGVPIPGATRPMLVRHSVTEADMGTYTCDVYNVAGSVLWEEMTVIVREDEGPRGTRSSRRY